MPVARCPLSKSVTFADKLLNSLPTRSPARELLLLPQLGDPRRTDQVDFIFPKGNDLIPHPGWIRIPPETRMRLFLGPGTNRRADGSTMNDNIGHFKHIDPAGGGGGLLTTVVSNRSILAAVAGGGGSGANGGGGRWGRIGTTAQRASTPDDGRRRGRESDPAEVGGDGSIMVGRCSSSLASFCGGPTVGITWREKKSFFLDRVGNILGEVGKKRFFSR